jgi:hypothetical protein
MSTPLTSVDQLKRAIAVAEQIEKLQGELSAILGGQSPTPTVSPKTESAGKKGKRTMSMEAREKIAAAQRARWAKSKGQKAATTLSGTDGKTARKKSGMSAAGRAAIAAAQKARWAKVRSAKAGDTSTRSSAAPMKKRKRKISPEAKARMVEAVKRRWAKQKATKGPTAAVINGIAQIEATAA